VSCGLRCACVLGVSVRGVVAVDFRLSPFGLWTFLLHRERFDLCGMDLSGKVRSKLF
jgi:hypothetical protein